MALKNPCKDCDFYTLENTKPYCGYKGEFITDKIGCIPYKKYTTRLTNKGVH